MTFRLSVSLVAIAAATAGCGGPEPPKPADKSPPPATGPATAPLVPVKKAADWCGEHGVPESACTRCNAELIAQFKEKGDWCEKHGLPRSQCVACDPSLEAKLKAMAPK